MTLANLVLLAEEAASKESGLDRALPLALPVITAFGGLLLGKTWDRRHWLRDRRMAAYSTLASHLIAQEYQMIAVEAAIGTGHHGTESRKAWNALDVIASSACEVELLGPPKVGRIAQEACRVSRAALQYYAMDEREDWPGVDTPRELAEGVRQAFVRKAQAVVQSSSPRDALRLRWLKLRVWWKRRRRARSPQRADD